MDKMFNHAAKFFQDLSGWDVSNVITHIDMFHISPMNLACGDGKRPHFKY